MKRRTYRRRIYWERRHVPPTHVLLARVVVRAIDQAFCRVIEEAFAFPRFFATALDEAAAKVALEMLNEAALEKAGDEA